MASNYAIQTTTMFGGHRVQENSVWPVTRMEKPMKRLVLSAALIFSVACSTASEPLVNPDQPEWVMKGSGAFDGEKQTKVFHGVGVVSGATARKNIGLARNAAGDRARAEISKAFETYSATLMRDYSSSIIGGKLEESEEEQVIEQAIRTFSATTLHGVQIVEYWKDPVDGSLYALARWSAESAQMSERMRQELEERSERMFKRLQEQELKHQERKSSSIDIE